MYIKKITYKFYPLIALVISAKFIEIIIPIFLGAFVHDIFTNHTMNTTPILFGIICIVSVLVLHFMQVLFVQKSTHKWLSKLREGYLKKLLRSPYSYYSSKSNSELFTKLFCELESIGEAVSQSLVSFLSHITLLIGILLALIWIEPKAVLPLYGVFFLVFLCTFLFRRVQKKLLWRMKKKEREMHALLLESFEIKNSIRSFQAIRILYKRLKKIQTQIAFYHKKTSKRGTKYLSSIDGAKTIFLIVGFIALTLLYPEGFPVGKFFSFSLYALIFFRPLVYFLEQFEGIQESLSSFEKARSFFDKIPKEEIKPIKDDSISSIGVENLACKRSVGWNGLSHTFYTGKSYVLVGAIGSGKSSFIEALLGFLPCSGKLTVNGVLYPLATLKALRSQSSVIFQEEEIIYKTLSDFLQNKEKLRVLASIGLSLRMLVNEALLNLSISIQKLSSKDRKRALFLNACAKNVSLYLFDEALATNDHLLMSAWNEFYKYKKKGAIFIIISHDEKPLSFLNERIDLKFKENASSLLER